MKRLLNEAPPDLFQGVIDKEWLILDLKGDGKISTRWQDLPDRYEIIPYIDLCQIGAWGWHCFTANPYPTRMETLFRLMREAGITRYSAYSEDIHDDINKYLIARLGLVEKIGVSVYSPSDLDDLSAFHFDLVQAPLNILDRRLVASGWLSRLHESGTEVHVRSAFLQGLLLMEHRPVYFQAWEPLLKRYDDWIEVSGLTRVEACLRFALAHPEVSRVVVGVDSVEQLREALRAERGRGVYPPGDLQSYDDRLLNPSNWTP